MSIADEILMILSLVLLNAILAMSEAALMSSKKTRLQQQASEGNNSAKRVLKLIEDPNVFLSTVQIGITLIGVSAGAVGGATISASLAEFFEGVPYLSAYSHSISIGIVVVVITILTIWLGELVPKRLGINSPEKIAQVVAGPMLLLSTIFSPMIRLMSKATNFVLHLAGMKTNSEPPITEEELQILINQGTQAGVFEESEQDMVEGIFSLGDSRVYSLMTPRTDMVWLDINDTVEEIRAKISECQFSRFPVRQDSLETILGIVRSRDLLVKSLSAEEINLSELLQPAHFIPETMFASRALELFKEKNAELLLVVDEFGGLQGLLTINDILEEIVGSMEFDEPQATQRQDGSWLLDGMLEVDEVKELFNFEILPHEGEYETLSGFAMTMLGRVPQASDHFEHSGFRFEVMDMDGRRVDKVLVIALPKSPSA